MPTKYQAQVMMTPKTKPIQVRTEAVAQPAPLHDSVVTRRASVGVVRPLPSSTRQPPETRVAPAAAANERLGYEVAKRVFDVIGGFFLLLVAIPIILVAAAIIRLETKGSPFFIQTRLGKNGKPFKIFKLRGMFIDAKFRRFR